MDSIGSTKTRIRGLRPQVHFLESTRSPLPRIITMKTLYFTKELWARLAAFQHACCGHPWHSFGCSQLLWHGLAPERSRDLCLTLGTSAVMNHAPRHRRRAGRVTSNWGARNPCPVNTNQVPWQRHSTTLATGGRTGSAIDTLTTRLSFMGCNEAKNGQQYVRGWTGFPKPKPAPIGNFIQVHVAGLISGSKASRVNPRFDFWLDPFFYIKYGKFLFSPVGTASPNVRVCTDAFFLISNQTTCKCSSFRSS